MNAAHVTIRAAQPQDAQALVAYMADPQVFGGLLQLPYPSEAAWRDRLTLQKPAGNGILLVADVAGRAVGCAGLLPVGAQVRRRHACTLVISVAREFQGRGIGSTLMAALIDYADRWGQVLRIELTVWVDNERAIALYERFGFVREGILRAYALRDGRYVDSLAMARLHPDPPRW